MKILLNWIFFLNIFFQVSAQSLPLPCCDAAQTVNNFLIEQANKFYRIGNFNVVGSPYLFGEDEQGTIYSASAGVHNINIRYNVYTQFVETTAKKDNSTVSIDLDNIDSFTLAAGKEHAADLKFINRSLFAGVKNGFLLVMSDGKDYALYKYYKSAIVSTITLRADQRQFELEYDFYYSDRSTKELKLIKPSTFFLKKEFGHKIDIKSFLKEHGTLSAEPLLILLFSKLNQ